MAQPEREERLARAFVELADTLADGFRLVDFLHVLSDHVTDLLGVEASGVVMIDGLGRLVDVTASSDAAHRLEELQTECGEGPCHDCCGTAEQVGPVDLTLTAALDRWPRFTAAARAAGFATVAALPLRLREDVIGALNALHTRSDGLTGPDLTLAQSLADAAAIGILHQRLAHEQAERVGQLHTALNSRIAIEQAKGALGARLDIAPEAAFDRLRRRARSQRTSLTRLCEEVVRGAADVALFSAPTEEPHRE
ncbi:GAF and ANTAR domain-containing protein [Streptomyces sp. NPDC050703]|uniref:GAF and ANTAR domain-containing protein n=1 Tax=Streptomyces sp. NPDC050703 TaxID=3157218 RepID=UPI00341A0799